MPKTLWRREEQTEGKHLVLRNYLDGWFPILGRWNGRLLYIDGFAGPGEYAGGERGSPLVALECVRRHKSEGRLANIEVVFLFIESKRDRADHLRDLLGAQSPIPDTQISVLQGTFDDHMTAILDYIDTQNATLAPAFVMIDPFGPKGSPMELIGRVLENAKSECLISFMYEPIRRFHERPQYERSLDGLFGTSSWRDCFDFSEEVERNRFLHGLFAEQLKKHGAKFVVPFELWKGNRYIYTLYFATGDLKGCDLMKASIWKIDPSGSFAFRGYAAGQLTLFGPDTSRLVEQLRSEFGTNWTPIKQIDDFVMGDETPFHKGHLRRKTLHPLERNGAIDVSRPQGGRGFPAGKGIRIRFK